MIPLWLATDVAAGFLALGVVTSVLAYRLGAVGREQARREARMARARARRAESAERQAQARLECAYEVQFVLAAHAKDLQRRVDGIAADMDALLGIGGEL